MVTITDIQRAVQALKAAFEFGNFMNTLTSSVPSTNILLP